MGLIVEFRVVLQYEYGLHSQRNNLAVSRAIIVVEYWWVGGEVAG